MKSDSKSYSSAQVDVTNAIFPEGKEIQFDLSNEIDVWSQIEFRARHQIHHLRHRGVFAPTVEVKKAASVFYSTRHRLED